MQHFYLRKVKLKLYKLFWNTIKSIISILLSSTRKGQEIEAVQLLSGVQLFATPWTVAHQAFLSIANSWSLLKLMSIESVMSSNHLILCHPILLLPSIFPGIRVFSSKSGGQSIGASALVLPMNIQDWFPLGWTGWISLQPKGLSRVFSNTSSKHQKLSTQLSL